MSSLLNPNAAIRKKRNFKGLQLDESPLSIPIPRLAKPASSDASDKPVGPSPAPSAPASTSTSASASASASAAAAAAAAGAPPPDHASASAPRDEPRHSTPADAPKLRGPFLPKPPPLAVPESSSPLAPSANPATAPAAQGRGTASPSAYQPPSSANSPDDRSSRSPGNLQRPPARFKKRAPTNLKLNLTPETTRSTPDGLSAGTDTKEGNANYHNKLSAQLASLELTGARRHKTGNAAGSLTVLSDTDLEFVSELGAGNGGTVTKVRHTPTQKTMAKKVVFIDAKPSVRKQILRELQIMHECESPYIIDFFGAYLNEPHICMCMEFMDQGSLDQIYKRVGPIPPAICARVANVVVNGLMYLYDVHRIIHRDVKPSNILANSYGQLKICDFGVSGELINSIADTFVGTSTYMSPERIQGDQYSVKSDVWSLGVTLIELALGRFPFGDEENEDGLQPPQAGKGATMQMSILDLLQHIVNEPSPRLPDTAEPKLRSFVDACLLKDPQVRASPKVLLQHPLITTATCTDAEIAMWLAKDDQ